MNESTQALHERLERLENEHRRMLRVHRIVLAILGIVAILGLVGWKSKVETVDTVAATRFELKDDSGRIAALLTMDTMGKPGMWFYNSSGKKRIQLGFAGDSDAGLWSFDANETQMINIHADDKGNPEVMCMQADGYPAISLEKQTGADGGVYVYDSGHRARAMLEYKANDIGMMRVAAKDGKIVAAISGDSSGSMLTMQDGEGNKRVTISSIGDSPYLSLFGAEGKKIAGLPAGSAPLGF